jgi:hypothetical protein
MAREIRINNSFTYKQLTYLNPLLMNGETYIESDTYRAKRGDGIHRYNELAYIDRQSGNQDPSGTGGDAITYRLNKVTDGQGSETIELVGSDGTVSRVTDNNSGEVWEEM